MIFDFITIDLFFRFVNFFLLVALGYYGFKKYVYYWAKEKIAHRKRLIVSLHEQKASLHSRLNELGDEIKEQRAYGVQVHHLADTWDAAVHYQVKERLKEKKEIAFKLDKKTEQGSQWLTRHFLQQQVFPSVLQDVQHELNDYFKESTEGLQFVARIVDYLEKKGAS